MFSLGYNPNEVDSSEVGLLLVGHGTREPEGIAEFHQLHHLLQQRAGNIPVSACFLELAKPDIATGIEQLLAQNVRRIVVCPLLLFAAGHAKRDIPDAVSEVLGGSSIRSTQLPPLGCHAKLLELSELQYQAAKVVKTVKNADFSAPNLSAEETDQHHAQTTLILVGRGSTDPAAIAEMGRFGAFRAERQRGVQVEVCFYAMAEPGLRETLAKVAKSAARRVVVQPHLLFSGAVLAGISQQTASAAEDAPADQNWFLTPPLGPATLLVEALWDQFLLAESV